MGESMEMLPEPSIPPPSEQVKAKELPEEPVTKPHDDLAQGRSTLFAYIQIADSQYQEAQPAEEGFVNAFVHGLRDKRDRKKCEKKVREGGTTWENLKECFPIASQRSQSLGKRSEVVRQRKRKIVDALETSEMQDGASKLLSSAKDVDRLEIAPTPPQPTPTQGRQNDQTNQAHDDAAAQPRRLSPLAAAQKANQVSPADRSADRAQAARKKRRLDDQNSGKRVEEARRDGVPPPPAAKKRSTKKGEGKGERRQEARRPSIPILPSSDDEFFLAWRK
jgi:hypothetical protein